MFRRDACPICGREMTFPEHRYGKKWTPLEIHWANKLLAAGLSRKAVARYFKVEAGRLDQAMRTERAERVK